MTARLLLCLQNQPLHTTDATLLPPTIYPSFPPRLLPSTIPSLSYSLPSPLPPSLPSSLPPHSDLQEPEVGVEDVAVLDARDGK